MVCVCVDTCLCVYVSAKNMLCHGIASWARALFTDRGSAVCSGNTGVTDHYTTLIMLSVNSRCKYPGKHIGPSGEHAHIRQTHTVVASHKFCQTRAVRRTASVTMCGCQIICVESIRWDVWNVLLFCGCCFKSY